MRTLLVLARVSNLPTVWSNCLAAWLISGGGSWSRFALLALGATLLYTGGMFLNDAMDQDFDRRYRPERPVVAGLISSRTVWILSLVWLLAGWLILGGLGTRSLVYATLLVLAIVFYDYIHKRTALSPLVMASCRFLLYFVACAAAANSIVGLLVPRATALAAYIVGLSYIARGESTGLKFARWTKVLLFAPLAVACVYSLEAWAVWIVAAVQVAWTCWCLASRVPKLMAWAPHGVAGLLAGIVLVDWLAATGAGHVSWAVFPLLFVSALALQRLAPAT